MKGSVYSFVSPSESAQPCSMCIPGKFSNTSNAIQCSSCIDGVSNFIYGATNCSETFKFVSSIEPKLGPNNGSTLVTFTGGNLNSTDRPVFQSGNTKIIAPSCTWISSSKITCLTPAFPADVKVSTFIDHQATSPLYSAPTFHYFSANFTSFSPRSGPILAQGLLEGGTRVVIQTQLPPTLQPETSKVKCRFGSTVPVSAVAVSTKSVICITPALGSVGNMDIHLSLNNQQYELVQGGPFIVYAVSLSFLSPRSGLKSGGTIVTVSGAGIRDTKETQKVSFKPASTTFEVVTNGAFTAGTVVTTTLQFHAVPPIAPGATVNSVVKLSPNNGAQYIGSLDFKLYEPHGLGSVTPSTAPASASGITISLSPDSGKAFANTGNEIRVRFRPSDGSINTVTGVFSSPSVITAEMPSITAPGRGDVSVALNNQQWSDWKELTLFRADSISPKWSPTSGGTLITINGIAFNNTGNLKCKFGSSAPVDATIIPGSDSQMTCTSPKLTTGDHIVSVTTNGVDFSTTSTDAVTLSVSPMPVPAAVTPSQIPAGMQSVQINVTGAGFNNTGSILVKFGSSAVVGTFVSTSKITCTAPSQVVGSYPVTVSLNGGVQYSAENGISLVSLMPTLTTLSPSSGPISGGTKLTISGAGFINTGIVGSMRVRFGQSQDVNVTSVTPSQIVLTTPPLVANLASSSTPNSLPIKVSTNSGSTFTTDVITIAIFDTSPSNFNSTSPSHAIITGGTVVDMLGTIPVVGSIPFVRLSDGNGWTSVPIVASRTAERVQFTVPRYEGLQDAPITLAVQLALNGQQFFSTQQSVIAFTAPSIAAISPQGKTPEKDIIVTIIGTGFIDTGNVRIRLGNTAFTPLSIESTAITFRSKPDHARGEYRVEVSLDAAQHFSISTQTDTFNVLSPLICPANTESYIPVPLTVNDCLCKPKFFTPTLKVGVACEPCPANADCAGRLAQPVAQPGFFNTGSKSAFEFTRCAVASACLGGNSTSSCATGYQGVLCGACVKGFHKLGDTCQPCTEGSTTMVVLIVFLFIAYLFFVKRQVRSATRTTGKVTAMAITHLQVMSTFSEYRLRWPDSVQNTLNLFSIANFNLDVAAPECSVAQEWTYESRFWLTLMLPFIVILGLLLRVVGQFIRAQWVMNNGDRFKANHPSFCAEPDTSLPKVKFVFDLMRFKLSTLFTESELVDQETLRHLLNEILFTLGLLYITLCNRVLEVFDCTEIRQGFEVMDVVPDEQCWVDGGMHSRLVGPAVVFLFVYVIGVPLSFFLVMLSGRNEKTRRKEAFQQKYSTLFNKYSDRFYWFEGMVMLRKAAVVAVKLFATNLPATQGLLGMVVIGSASLIQIDSKPYKTSAQNRLEIILLVESLLILLSGMIFFTETNQDSRIRQGWEVLTIFIAVTVILVCLFYVGRDIWNRISEAKTAKQRTSKQNNAIETFVQTVGGIINPDLQPRLQELADEDYSNSRLKMLSKAVETAMTRKKDQFEHDLVTLLDAGRIVLKPSQLHDFVALLINPLAQSTSNDELKELILKLANEDSGIKQQVSKRFGRHKGKDLEMSELRDDRE
eukprot:TRINITY_DN93_c0_g2_i13.p1 TRINITY_DN93_c0_g2~~TRINITY_DN93_c0_g2_i13.p1  ORF type:complete len:1563 (+),score=447.84 TRINITY_DN93_c0_g2_i13:1329-6017(+)